MWKTDIGRFRKQLGDHSTHVEDRVTYTWVDSDSGKVESDSGHILKVKPIQFAREHGMWETESN